MDTSTYEKLKTTYKDKPSEIYVCMSCKQDVAGYGWLCG